MFVDPETLLPVVPPKKVTTDKEKIDKYLENSRKLDLIPELCRRVIQSGPIEYMIKQQEELLSSIKLKEM